MRPTVLLFDIDGTLVTTGGAGRRSMAAAFEDLHGRKDACESFSISGMTDRAILRKGLQALSVEPTEARIDALLARYLAHLKLEVPRVADGPYRVHPGVRSALEELGERPGYAIGLGTGNVREGAQVKLQRVDLYDHFAFGGFGCDAEDRMELIRIGAQRGADQLETPLEACRVVVIGDTPKDIAAAHGIGAICLAVATGTYRADVLTEAGADFVYEDLSVPGALEVLLASS